MDRWALIEAYFSEKSLVQHHIDSYNQLVEERIPEIIEEEGVIDPGIGDFRIELKGVKLDRPKIVEVDGAVRKLLPMEARIRNRTYAASIYVEMSAIRRGVEIQRETIEIGKFPVMLKSCLCWLSDMTEDELVEAGEDPLDPGGYFIINGTERIIVNFEEVAPNKIIVSPGNRSGVVAQAAVRSRRGAYTGPVVVERKTNGIWLVSAPALPKMKLMILLRALGFEDDSMILDAFLGEKEILNDALLNIEACEIKTTEEALDWIGKDVAPGQVKEYRLQRAQEIIDNYLLPHIGRNPEDRIAKGYFLIRMAERASEAAYGLRPFDDKDHFANKRVATSGKMLENLFITAWRALVRDIRYQVERAIARRRKLRLQTVVRPSAFTDAVMFSMGNGLWQAPRYTGVTAIPRRTAFQGIIIDLRQLKSPLPARRQNFEARELHGTHYGRLCPIKTPEGQRCGLNKFFALMATVTTRVDEKKIEKMLRKMGVKIR